MNSNQHFNHIAKKYNYYRVLDKEPIDFLIGIIPKIEQNICDLGSGTGRYLIPLIKAIQSYPIPIKKVYGIDNNSGMLDIAKYQTNKLNMPIDWILASADNTGLSTKSISLVTSFNSIHHIPIRSTLTEIERILIPEGYLAIYIRVQDQESEHIWGQWFPDYIKYSQVPTREFMINLHYYNSKFQFIQFKDFTYKRKTTLEWIQEQTKNKHYSTLARYSDRRFAKAFSKFLNNIKLKYENQNEIIYYSSYSFFLYKIKPERRLK